MKKYYIALAIFAALVVVAPQARAGDCYEYPTKEITGSATIRSGVNIRTIACMEGSSVIGSVTTGTKVTLLAENDGWYKVSTGGKEGWIWGSFLSLGETSETGKTYDENPVITVADDLDAVATDDKTTDTTSTDDKVKLRTRLKGYILLQADANGEAWYVDPSTTKRFYMKDGATAYQMMRGFGLGISNADLEKLQAKRDAKMLARLKGKILLQVQLHGEAYYIDPQDGTIHYLKDGDAAYVLMRKHSLGITTSDLKKFDAGDENEFKKEEEDKKSEDKDTTKKATSSDSTVSVGAAGNVALSALVVGEKAQLSWVVTDAKTGMGFKLVTSSEPNPVYPGDSYVYLSNGATRSHTIALEDGTTHVRVCIYNGKCLLYSNDLALTRATSTDSTVDTTTDTSTSDDVSIDESSINAIAQQDTYALNVYWLDKVNALRAEKGLRQLALDSRWKATALEWATYMASINQMTHTRPDGKTMHQWIDTKGLPFTVRYSEGGWETNYFTENISWGISDGTLAGTKKVLDDTMALFLSEAASNGAHYRTIYHADWNSEGLGVYLKPLDNGTYKVFVTFHYGSLVL